MAKDPLLRDAVKSIKGKIITAATTASPEDLAYLGTAIDRIGGRATVLEVEETGDIIMQELTDHGAAVEAATIASINATRDAAQAAVTDTKTAAEKSITDTKTAAVKTMTDTQTATTDAVTAATEDARKLSVGACPPLLTMGTSSLLSSMNVLRCIVRGGHVSHPLHSAPWWQLRLLLSQRLMGGLHLAHAACRLCRRAMVILWLAMHNITITALVLASSLSINVPIPQS